MRAVGGFLRRALKFIAVALLGFLGGGFTLYVVTLNAGSAPQLWHTVELAEEFSSERVGEVGTFEQYLELEERLFEEVRRKVYAETPTGPEHRLVRFSEGSFSDPARWPVDWNRSFELPAEDLAGGVLLLHGMSDSPYSLRSIGETLAGRGFWVVGLRLPGHGTAPAGLKDVSAGDMAAAVRLAMEHLSARVGAAPLHMIGYSTGAALAIDYALDGAARAGPASLVLVSPAIGVTPAAELTRWLVRAARLPGLEKLAWTSLVPEFDPFKYNSFTSNAGLQVHDLTRRVAGRLAARSADGPVDDFPATLVLLSSADATVSVDAVVDNLLEHLAPGRNELILFDVNRSSVTSSLLVRDPGPLTLRLLQSDELPFHFTLITNASPGSMAVVERRKPALSVRHWTEPLGMSWPEPLLSLSHVALTFPPDDPLYGSEVPGVVDRVFLGHIGIQGERGLLRFPADWLVRLRHNPFYDYLESRTVEWLDGVGSETRR